MAILDYRHRANLRRLEELKAMGFEFAIGASGYFVKFKGKGIGGASILGKSRARGAGRTQDLREYAGSAIRTAELSAEYVAACLGQGE